MKYPVMLSVFIVCGLLAAPPSAWASPGHKPPDYGRPGNPKKVTRTVTVKATEIAFDAQIIKAKKGETIRIILINDGLQDHELTIGNEAVQQEHRAMMTSMTPEAMAKAGHKHDNAVNAKPGQTRELVWTFTKPGIYVFACNYPGHAELGMQGKVIVE